MGDIGRLLKAEIVVSTPGAGAAEESLGRVGSAYDKLASKPASGANFAAQSKALKDLSSQAQGAGRAFTLTRQEALTLNYTIGDIVASIASGASPLTILLQQGGQVRDGFGSLGNLLSKIAIQFARFAPQIAAIGAAIAGISFFKIGESAAAAAEEVGKLANRAGLTASAFQDLAAAGAARGIAPEELAQGFKSLGDAALKSAVEQDKLNREIAAGRNATTGIIADTGLAAKAQEQYAVSVHATGNAFRDLGVSIPKNFTGTPEQIESLIYRVANALKSLPNSQKAAEISRSFEGIFGFNILNLLKQGEKGLREFQTRVNAIAPKLSDEQVAQATKYEEASRIYDEANKRLKESVGILALPALTGAQDFFSGLLQSKAGAVAGLKDTLSSAATAIKDFFAILSGDQQAASANPTLTLIADALFTVAGAARIAGSVVSASFKVIKAAAGSVAKTINDVFGTNFNASTILVAAALLKILNPIGLISGALKALIGVPGLLVGAFELLSGKATAALNLIGDAVGFLTSRLFLIPAILITLATFIYAYRKPFEQIFQTIGDYAVAYIGGSFAKLGGYWSLFWAKVAGTSKDVEDAQKGILDIEKKQQAILQSTPKIEWGKLLSWQPFLDTLTDVANTAKNTVGPIIKGIFDYGKEGVQGLIGETKKATDAAQKTAENTSSVTIIKAGVAQKVDIYREGLRQVQGLQKEIETTVTRGTSVDKVSVPVENIGKAADKSKASVDGLNQSIGQIQVDKIEIPTAPVKAEAPKAQGQDIKPLVDDTNKIKENTAEINKTPIGPKADTAGVEALNAKLDAGIEKKQKLEAAPPAAPASLPPTQPQASPLAAPISEANTAIDALKQKLAQAISDAQALAAGAVSIVANSIVSSVGTANTSIDSLTAALNRAIQSVQQLASALSSLPALPDYSGSNTGGGGKVNGGGGAPMASGGLVSGPGTATSDSIPAWLSAGEFVVRAAAVSHYGVDFLRRINGLRISTPRMAPLRFADGGLVSSMSRALGPASGGSRSLTLVLEGKSFGGLTGPSTVIADLEKHAISRRIASTTKRAPSWER